MGGGRGAVRARPVERGGGGGLAAVGVLGVWGRGARLHRRGLCDDGGHAAAGGDCATFSDAVGGGAAGRGAGEHYAAAEEWESGGVGGAGAVGDGRGYVRGRSGWLHLALRFASG